MAMEWLSIISAGLWSRVNKSSSPVTLLSRFSQSKGFCCRKILIVGYHGLSSRSTIQRQSEAKGSNSQTGLPIAPARCATEVSTDITRSRFSTAPAVSVKSSNCSPRLAAIILSDNSRTCCAALPFCNPYSLTPGIPASGEKNLKGQERLTSVNLPDHTRPTFKLFPLSCFCQRSAFFGSA